MAILRSRAARRSAYALGGLVFLLTVAYWLLQTDWAREAAFARLRQGLRQENILLEGGHLDYDLFGLRAGLRDVTLRSAQSPTLPPIATIQGAEVALNWRTLTTLSLDIDSATLTGAQIHVVIGQDGRTNIPQSPESKQAHQSRVWLMRKLTAPDASLLVEDRMHDVTVALKPATFTMNGSPATREHALVLATSKAGELLFQGRRLPVQQLMIAATLENDALRVEQASIVSGASRVDLSGRLDHFAGLALGVHVKSTLDVAPLALFLGRAERLEGKLQLETEAKGTLDRLKVSGTVAGEQLAYREFNGIGLTAQAAYDGATKRVRVASSNIYSADGRVQATADIALESGESQAAARVDRADLVRLARIAKSAIVPASQATLTLNAKWPALDYAKATGNGELRLTPTQTEPAPNRLPVMADIVFSGRMDQVKADIRSLNAAGAEATGTLYLSQRRNLSGTFTAGSNSLATMLRQSNRLLSKNFAMEGFDGRAAVQGTVGGTLNSPTLEAAAGVEDLQAGQLKGATLNSGLTYSNQLVTASGLALRWKGQSLLAEGTLNLTNHAVDVSAHTDSVKIETVLASLGHGDVQLNGDLTANIRAGGTLDQPTATIALNGAQLMAYAEPIGALRAQAELSNNLLNLTQFVLPQKDLRASGTYHLQTGTYTLDAQSPSLQLTGLQLPDGSRIRGTFSLSAQGAGTTANLQLDAKLSAGALRIDGHDYGDVKLAATVKDHAADILASAPRYDVTATARVGTAAPYATTFDVRANSLPIDTLPVPAGWPLTGSIRAAVEGSGELDRWQKGTAKFSIQPVDVKWNNEAVTTPGPILGEFANETFEVKQAQLLAAGSQLSVAGSLPLDSKSTQGLLRVDGEVDLAAASKLVPDWKQPINAGGKLTLSAELRGNLKRIEPTATLALRDGFIIPTNLNPVSGIELAAQIQDGTVTLNRLTGTWAKAQLSATGEFPLGLLPPGLPIDFPRRTGPAKLVLDAKGLDISMMEGVPANTSGTVAFHVDAESDKAEIASLKARVTVEEMRVKVGDIILAQTGTSSINVADGVARIESFTLAGPGTDLALRGRASLLGDYPIALRLAGNIETGVLSTLIAPARMRGPARIQLSVYGPAQSLKAAGFVEVTDGQLLLPRPRIAADNVNARIDVTGDRLEIVRFDGSLNGGTLTAKGGFRFTGSEARDINLALDAKNVYLDYPYGLRTLSNAAITMQQNLLSGNIAVQEGSFRELVTVEGNLLSLLNSSGADNVFPEERNRYLDRTQFNVNITSESPLLVKNNLAKAGVNLDLRLTGNYYQPGLLGRITLEEGGELYFSERSYAVERGVITFTNDRKIEPALDILARTKVASHDISLLIEGGGAEKVSTALSSDPPVPEQDILAMLITGKSPEEFKNSDTATLASRQALSYFAGSFGSRFTRQLERATGLSTVRVEPDLIANESNPTARLTIGQDLSPAARLIYSMNLVNGGDQIYVAEYDITKRFTTRGVKQIDNTYRFEFRHDLRFGGEKPATASTKGRASRVIGTVAMPAGGPIDEQTLRDKFKNKTGKRYDFFEVRKGLDRLESLYRNADLLEARVRVRRDIKESSVDLALDIDAGPKLAFAYEGWEPGRKLREQVRQIWSDGVFDAQRVDDASRALKTSLIESGYLEASIAPKVTANERKLVTFDVQPGVKYGAARLEFPGASGIKDSELRKILKRRDLRAALYLDPPKVRDLMESYYRERGYLDVKIQVPPAEFDARAGQATVRMKVTEGPRYQVSSVKFEGNTAMKPEKLTALSALKADEPYQLPLRKVSLDQLRELYYAAGYREAQVETNVERGPGKVDVTYRITEGPKEVVQKIEVSGNDATSETLVRSQLTLKTGDALEPAKLTESRRNLYSTGAYSLVDLERVPAGDVSAAGIRPILLRAKVREVQPFEIKYGAYLDTDRGPGAIVDFTNRNSLGSARAIGGRLRYDGDFREGRVFFSQPLLRRFPLQTIFSGFVNRALLPTFVTDRTGVSVQQEMRFKKRYLLNYGYRLERVHTYEKTPDTFLPFDVTLRVAPLTFTMNRETRDDILDATKGSFISHAFEWAPELLGSDVRFVRYYAQYFKYVALAKPVEIPMSGGVKKPRLVYAGAARLGLARGLGGQDLVLSERFFAGGGTTLRGFAQNTLGPKDFLGEPAGGDAVVLINNELRFPVASIFDAVGFVDVGNAYRRASDFSFGDLRKAAGAGLRIRTPYFLIRLDYGFKLDRRPGESRGGFFFSIGQAF